jgi:hypothetical protein
VAPFQGYVLEAAIIDYLWGDGESSLADEDEPLSSTSTARGHRLGLQPGQPISMDIIYYNAIRVCNLR